MKHVAEEEKVKMIEDFNCWESENKTELQFPFELNKNKAVGTLTRQVRGIFRLLVYLCSS